MKNPLLITLIILMLFMKVTVWGQQTPQLQVTGLYENEKPVRISDIKIDVKVVGSLAVTTVDMIFHNPNNRILEGELQFPLADGQSVSRFALDINGKLREGVVVEKAKGQQVFESVIRRKVDPALLEKTSGNNFRTRVYPLPAKGTRRIVLAYEQELIPDAGNYRFHLPIEYKDIVDNFDLNLTVFAKGNKPSIDKSPWGTFSFDNAGEAYVAHYSAKNYKAQGQVVFSVPVKDDIQLYIEKGDIDKRITFYTHLSPRIQPSEKKLPKRIALFWDTSLSMNKRNLKLETQLLDKYFKQIGNLTVDLYSFNFKAIKPQSFKIVNGKWDALKDALSQSIYDGATHLGTINFSKYQADEILLFTDGLNNFGKDTPITGTTPVITVTSNSSADYSLLQYLAMSTGGVAINLMQQTPDESMKLLAKESLRLISVDYKSEEITDLTTSGHIIDPTKGISIAGKLLGNKATLTLHFGTGKKVSESKTITINAKDVAKYGNIVERLWAAKRISELDRLYDKNKEEIEKLGRKYNIVTRNTSLIVLDDVNDYVQHRITPPEDLLEQYNMLVQQQEKEILDNKKYHIDNVVNMLADRKEWWNKDFTYKPKPSKPSVPQPNPPIIIMQPLPIDESSIVARGVIKDEQGEPIIGANVTAKSNPNIGTLTDMNGGYSLRINPQDKIVVSYLGYNSMEVDAEDSSRDIVLSAESLMLDEVVVAMGVARESRDLAISASEINEDAEFEMLILPDAKIAPETLTSSYSDSSIDIKVWEADTPYMDALKKVKDNELYKTYLTLREEYLSAPSFYLDVATLFEQRGLKDDALLILSNLAELKLEDYRLIRVLAHRLKQLDYNNYAIYLFREVVDLRPEEPQSFRDLGLALAQNKEYQEAIDVHYKIVEKEWDARFPQIELFAVEEINNIIAKAKKLDLKNIDKRLIYNMPVDIRIVLNWDTDNSDMDLWVIDPNDEKCYYQNTLNKSGGMITRDFTDGYGPEAFLIKKAPKGKYIIQANYYGTREQTLIGPTTVYLDVYTYYGTDRETKKTIMLRLSENKEIVEIGKIEF